LIRIEDLAVERGDHRNHHRVLSITASASAAASPSDTHPSADRPVPSRPSKRARRVADPGPADRANKRGEIEHNSPIDSHGSTLGEYPASRHLHRSDPHLPGGQQCVHQRGHEYLRRAGFHVPPTVKAVPRLDTRCRRRCCRYRAGRCPLDAREAAARSCVRTPRMRLLGTTRRSRNDELELRE
jgi:hypothetical protein